MAVEARRHTGIARLRHYPGHSVPALTASTHLRERLWNVLPLSLSLLLASFVFWGPWNPSTAMVLAFSLVAFYVYWLIRSYAVAVACVVGLRKIRQFERTNWLAKYCSWLPANPGAERWEWPRHIVIVPNYKESEHELARTIGSLAAQANARQLIVVLAMEAREVGARRKATRLLMRFRTRFGDMFATYHPVGLPGETPGKGSNEAWAARLAYERFILQAHDDIDRYTITSCDADAVFHPRHFEALNYMFLTSEDRYRAFWQPTIFNSNNIWDIPAPLRIPDGLSGINRLSNLVLPGSVKFPTSCYSLSFRMLHEVDFWDEEVIPEDWHLYLKCSFTLGDRVHVEPIFLPLGNDCVMTDRYTKTLRAHYFQSVRHAWGASDIPYAWRATLSVESPLSMKRRLVLTGAVTKVHALWMAQWYILTVGVVFSSKIAVGLGAPMPGWWTVSYAVPGPGWHPTNITRPGDWLNFDSTGIIEPVMWLNICGVIIAACIVPLITLIIVESLTRPPRPSYVSRKQHAGQFLMWPLMAIITFFWASLPALHAQIKLASGKGLVYRVAEKGSRTLPPEPAPTVQLGAVGR
jgi:hypothetical protein